MAVSCFFGFTPRGDLNATGSCFFTRTIGSSLGGSLSYEVLEELDREVLFILFRKIEKPETCKIGLCCSGFFAPFFANDFVRLVAAFLGAPIKTLDDLDRNCDDEEFRGFDRSAIDFNNSRYFRRRSSMSLFTGSMTPKRGDGNLGCIYCPKNIRAQHTN
jgi:hypothetical protein